MSPIETAVKMSKRVKMNTLEAVSNIVGEYETTGMGCRFVLQLNPLTISRLMPTLWT
jgi:hypothetical protein